MARSSEEDYILEKPLSIEHNTGGYESGELEQDRLQVGGYEFFERIECLRDDLRHVRERWNNRLVLEDGTFGERYLNGDIEVIACLDGDAGLNNAYLAIRIPADRTVLNGIRANSGVDVFDLYDGNRRDEIVVFVTVAETCSGPEIKIRVPARLYVFDDIPSKLGEGLLYQSVISGGFKVLPFSRKREMEFPAPTPCPISRVDPKIKGFSKVVNGITDDWRKVVRDRLVWAVSDLKNIRLGKDSHRPSRTIGDLVKIGGQGGRELNQVVDVFVGPFDL